MEKLRQSREYYSEIKAVSTPKSQNTSKEYEDYANLLLTFLVRLILRTLCARIMTAQA